MDNWLDKEILLHYPEAKTVMLLVSGKFELKGFDGLAFECPDVIYTKNIPHDRLTFIINCREIMHSKSILFVEMLQSDLDDYVIEAGMNLIKVFKEGLNFVFVIKK